MDTVEEFDPDNDTGTGFRFTTPAAFEFEDAINRALDLYSSDPKIWQRLMIRGMQRDFSWNRSAQDYLKLYERAVQDRLNYLGK